MLSTLFKKKRLGPTHKLIVHDAAATVPCTSTTFGGKPVAGPGSDFAWPTCGSCNGNMQYLGKVADGEFINLIFMCQNDPGMCDEWSPGGGGNAVLRVAANELTTVEPPSTGNTTRKTEYGAKTVETTGQSYSEARQVWSDKQRVSPREVLGLLGGEPEWLQADETPDCETCDAQMRFVAQLEQGPDYRTEMNFGGGGCAYLFTCDGCNLSRFLWQC